MKLARKRTSGVVRSENAGMSNERRVRILPAEISEVSVATLFVYGLGDPNMRPV